MEYKSLPDIRKLIPKGVVRLHTDGGTEYKSFTNIFKTSTAPYTPQHNPFAERVNRTLLEPARTVLEGVGLGRKYWSYVVKHVTYVKNGLPHLTLGCTPFEKLTEKHPSPHHVRVFKCASFSYNSALYSKFHAKAISGTYLGVNDHGIYEIESISDRRLQYSGTSHMTRPAFLHYHK